MMQPHERVGPASLVLAPQRATGEPYTTSELVAAGAKRSRPGADTPERQGGTEFDRHCFRLQFTQKQEELSSMNFEKLMGEDKRNNSLPEKCANKPNLWRVVSELSKLRDPYRAVDMLLAIAGPALKQVEDEGRARE